MDKALYISQYHEDYLDQFKMGLLYFDRLEIPLYYQQFGQPIGPGPRQGTLLAKVIERNYFISENFKAHLEPLLSEKIIVYNKILYDGDRHSDDSVGGEHDPIGTFIVKNIKSLFKDPQIEKEEDGSVIYTGTRIDELVPFEDYLQHLPYPSPGVMNYASRQLTTFLKALSKNETCLITGDYLHNLFSSYITSKNFNKFSDSFRLRKAITASVAFNAIQLAIPDISNLSFEQILDLKFKLKEELLAFKIEVERMVLELELSTPLSEIYNKSDIIVKVKIQPILNDLINKMKSITVYKNLLDNIKDPKSYSPLLLSLTNNISNTQVLLSSLGLISLSAALDFYEKNRSLQANGHYYLLKLNNLKHSKSKINIKQRR